MTSFQYGAETMTVPLAIDLAKGRRQGSISSLTHQRIAGSHAAVQQIVADQRSVYGINTGLGILSNTIIDAKDTALLQYKLLQSHSVGVGEAVPILQAKLMLITKVQALAQGYSGIHPNTLARILWHIDNDCIPVVPVKGSVGASGDLAPLAHLFLPLLGLGEVFYQGKRIPTLELFQQVGLSPIQLGPKEGLALINGTQFILAYAVSAIERMHNCLEAADIIGAMSLEALTGTQSPFDER
ncbi:MAG: aromatic amino acid lyase, partial [Chitinophagaceae bacterium]